MGRSIYFTDLEIEKLIDVYLIQLNCWEKQKVHGSRLPRIWKMDLDRQ